MDRFPYKTIAISKDRMDADNLAAIKALAALRGITVGDVDVAGLLCGHG